jgi:hypothetical protein
LFEFLLQSFYHHLINSVTQDVSKGAASAHDQIVVLGVFRYHGLNFGRRLFGCGVLHQFNTNHESSPADVFYDTVLFLCRRQDIQ